MRSTPAEEKNSKLRITNQFHSKGGMAYDLVCDGVRITLRVSPRARDTDPGEWCVEARSPRAAEDAAIVSAWGASRRDALDAVGRAWSSNADTYGLRVFDWDAVAGLLTSVRAL